MAVQVSLADIRKVSDGILQAIGVSEGHRRIIVESIVYAHGRGKGTHGIGRLPIYVEKIDNGLMNANTPIDMVRDHKASAILSANHGFGQVASIEAVDLAVRKASRYGIASVAVRASNNFGTVGFVCEHAAKQGMVALVFSNASPAIAPSGGKKPILGTNPLGIAFPKSKSGMMISLDMATSATARGKIRQAAKDEALIPYGWALDEDGHPTNDPGKALKGSMLALGGHKGYGLSLCIDVLAGLLSGAGFAGRVLPLSSKTGYSDYGHLIIVMDVSFYLEMNEFQEQIEYLIAEIKKTSSSNDVLVPGESNRGYTEGSKVDISEKVAAEINSLALRFNSARFKYGSDT